MRYSLPFILGLSLATPCLGASFYQDSKLPVRFWVPTGWKVRPISLKGQRALRVIPNKADQRERAAIEIIIKQATLTPKQTLTHYALRERGKREAISPLSYEWKKGRLETDYRGGEYVENRLWIMRRTKMVLQRIDKQTLIDARCAANITEYNTYKESLNRICRSIQIITP